MSLAPKAPDTRPAPIYGSLGLLLPIIGLGLGWAIGTATQRHDGSGAAWAPMALFWALGMGGIGSIVGIGCATYSLWRLERWPLLAAIAVSANGGALLSVIKSLL